MQEGVVAATVMAGEAAVPATATRKYCPHCHGGLQVHAGEGLKQAQTGCSLPPAPCARHEYSSMDVTLEVVPDMAAAIDHIHANGSGHTGACAG